MRMALFFIALVPGVIVWVLGGLVFFGMALEKNFNPTVAFLWVPIWIGLSAYFLPKIIKEAIDGDLKDVENKLRRERAEARAQQELVFEESRLRHQKIANAAIREIMAGDVLVRQEAELARMRPKSREEIAKEDRRFEEWKKNYPHQ